LSWKNCHPQSLASRFTNDKERLTFHGPTDLKKAIAESCNVYFYIVGGGFEERKGLGVTKIKKYLELFNLGRPTGIELLGEAGGLIPDPEWKKRRFSDPQEKIWRDGDTYNLSIGQGFILATPLQIATAFSALVNGGKIFQPQLVQKIVDSERNLLKEIEPKIIHELNVDPKNLEIIKEGMLQAVTGENSPQATAVLLNSLPIKVGAKTGTAEAWQRGEKIYHTWITVFAPYENPKLF
jgi:penicillin-binding protein 2